MTKKKFTDRRTFLKTTGALGSASALSALAGCLGGDDGGSDDETTDADSGGSGGTTTSGGTGGNSDKGDSKVREKYGLSELDYEVEDKLNVYQWTDYWPKGTVEIFEKAYGVKVNVANYASNEEMFSKLKAGGTGQYDVIFPSDYMINIMVQQGMIRALDQSKLPNWDNLEQKWIDQAPYDPGEKRHSAPYQWGTSGIGYNENMVEVDATSWDAMWNEEYKGQITMLNDMRETIGASLKRLGYSLNTKDESKIQEAKEALIDQKPLLLNYDSVNVAENLINKQASPAHGWSGDVFSAYWELYQDDDSPITYAIPEEGGVVWIDTAAITKDAKHPNAAHAFINFVLNAKINAKITNYVYYPTPNEAAKEFVDEAALNNEAIYPPDEVMEKLEFIRNLGQATKLYSEAWTEIQNA